MDPEETISDTPLPPQHARGCYKANLILNAFVALGLSVTIILILTIFNHGGWFALLSGLFGALLYSAVVFPRLLFGPIPVPDRHNRLNQTHGNNGEPATEQGDRQRAKRMSISGLITSGILATTAGIGLIYLPANRPLFAFVDAILAIVLCITLFMLALSILMLFFGRAHSNDNSSIYIDM